MRGNLGRGGLQSPDRSDYLVIKVVANAVERELQSLFQATLLGAAQVSGPAVLQHRHHEPQRRQQGDEAAREPRATLDLIEFHTAPLLR